MAVPMTLGETIWRDCATNEFRSNSAYFSHLPLGREGALEAIENGQWAFQIRNGKQETAGFGWADYAVQHCAKAQ